MSWVIYDQFRLKQVKGLGGMDLSAATVLCALVTAAYVPDQNLDALFTDAGIQSNEVSGVNYVAGGNAINNLLVTMNNSGLIIIDGDDPATWVKDAGGFTNARYAVLYEQAGGKLIAYADLGSDKDNVNDAYKVELASAGIITASRPV